MKARWIAALVGALSLGSAVTRADTDDTASSDVADVSFRDRFGVSAGAKLTESTSVADRVRGLERLGSTGTPRAVARLTRALAPGATGVTPEERLTAVRALAAVPFDASASRALAAVVGGHVTPDRDDVPHPLDALAEATAAVALARSGTSEALSTLRKNLGVRGRAADYAANALLAYPPRDLSIVLRGAAPTVTLATLLGRLGDQRALPALRGLVRGPAVAVRGDAAIALTELGDYEAVDIARTWQNAEPSLRVAGARILALARAADAPAAIAALLRADATRDDGLALALLLPDPALVPALALLAVSDDVAVAEKALRAVGRSGGRDAVRVLESALARTGTAGFAAEALSRLSTADGVEARAAIGRALARSETRRMAVRAAAARLALLGDETPGLRAVLPALSRSPDAADRAVAALAHGVLDRGNIWPLLWSNDEAVTQVAASLIPFAGPAVGAAVAARLPRGDGPFTISLAEPGARRAVPSTVLAALLGGGSARNPLVLLALAERDDERTRDDLEAFRASPDPAMRRHVALGLAVSSEPDATGRLESMYRFEADIDVRAAVVRALSQRPAATRNRTLLFAAGLDPDAAVRSAARLALGGTRLVTRTTGDAVLWLRANEAARGNARSYVVLPSGVWLPVEPDPEGYLVVPGLPEGSRAVRVAAEHEAEDAPGRGSIGSEKNDPRPGAERRR
jgi:hypothetical protein